MVGPEFRGVMAAPNQARIRARVVFALPSPEHRDKLIIRLEILDSKKVRGPNFAHLGSTVEAFAFDPPQGLGEGTEIVAEAEFLGDERGGKFRLTGIEVQG